MLRDRSPTETLMTYATFFALSVAIHMVVILGGRPEASSGALAPGDQAQATAREADAQGAR